jgi:DNA-binding PadR family transcriptional regulator
MGYSAKGMADMTRHKGTPPAPFVERGGVKFAIMKLLKDRPRHGYDIIRALGEHSMGMYSPSAGAIYPVLQSLDDQGLLVSSAEGGKKVYSLTPAGLDFLVKNKDEAQRHEARWFAQLASVAGEDGEAWKAITAARDLVEDLMSEVWATANVPVKRQEIRAVLEETVKRMRGIADR